MRFQCLNCGGNMVFAPDKQKMYCPFCEGEDCENKLENDSLTVCPSCGGELNLGEFTSASRCPYCNNYLVFEERISGMYTPDSVLPFKISKKDAVEHIDKEFKKRLFAPASFLSEKTLEDMNGYYVPFFMYDYKADSVYEGTATRVRKWSSGNYDYTETSFYEVKRRMHVEYDNIPADASNEMPDENMDLIEPYDYEALVSFNPKYMSGFFGEIYNATSDKYEGRAKKKAVESAAALLHGSLSGYTTLSPRVDTTTLTPGKVDYTLFPVWIYKYKWNGTIYPFYVNGQTGKVIGKTPISKLKAFLYAGTTGLLLLACIEMILRIVEVL